MPTVTHILDGVQLEVQKQLITRISEDCMNRMADKYLHYRERDARANASNYRSYAATA